MANMKIENTVLDNEKVGSKGIEAMQKASEIAKKLGIADMTLDEINEEINRTRQKQNK